MAKLERLHSTTSFMMRVKLLDKSAADGTGKTGLTENSAGLIISTIADNESSATAYTQAGGTIEDITTTGTLGTYEAPTASHCRFQEIDSTNHPGVYEIHLADARLAVASATTLILSISGADDMIQGDWEIDLGAGVAKMAGTLQTLDALDTAQDAQHADTQSKADTIDTVVDAIKAVTDLLPDSGALSSLSTLTAAQVNAQVLDVIATDVIAQLTQGAPPATPSLQQAIMYLYQTWRNKVTESATEWKSYDDAGSTEICKRTVSDDGTTFTAGEVITGT